ncbi:hypothetical protein [Gordonia sp. GN26]
MIGEAFATGEADKISAMLRETERVDSYALAENYRAQQKLSALLRKNRRAMESGGPNHPPTGSGMISSPPPAPGIPEVSIWSNLDPWLAPHIVPAWDPRVLFLARNGWTVRDLLASPQFLETGYGNKKTRLRRDGCCWTNHAASPPGSTEGSLLTMTRGQWVGVWWVCPSCRQALDTKYRTGLCWHTPSPEANLA